MQKLAAVHNLISLSNSTKIEAKLVFTATDFFTHSNSGTWNTGGESELLTAHYCQHSMNVVCNVNSLKERYMGEEWILSLHMGYHY